MKKIKAIAIAAALVTMQGVMAQEKTECEIKFENFREQAVVKKDIVAAEPLLKDIVKQCPKFDSEIYLIGEGLYNIKIESSRTPEAKKESIDALLSHYADYEKNFPGNGSVVRKALLMKKESLADDAEVYKMLDSFFTAHRDKFTDYDGLQEYFMLYLKQYESEDKSVSQKDFVKKYGDIAAQVAYAQSLNRQRKSALLQKQEAEPLTVLEKQEITDADTRIDALEAVKDNINMLASKHFSQEILEEHFAGELEKRKGDIQWMEAVAKVMYDNKYYRSPLLLETAEAVHAKRNDAESAYMLGETLLKSGNTPKALSLFQEAAVKTQNKTEKSELYYKLASIYRNSDRAQAKKFALMAADINEGYGKPYLFLAEMYASAGNECGLNEFQRNALLFKSMEMLNKAEAAEPKYKPTVAAMNKEYQKRLPDKKAAKAAGYSKGDQLTYGCWINETVTLPKL